MHLLLMALSVGCFGWLISYCFIKLLFFPARTLQIKSIQIQSPFVKIFKDLPIENIITKCTGAESFSSLLPFIDAKLDEFFKLRLVQKMPVISMFIGDKTISQLKEVFIDELEQLLPQLSQQMAPVLQTKFLSNVESQWSSSIEKFLLRATFKIRIIAFCMGFLWGIFMYYIVHAF